MRGSTRTIDPRCPPRASRATRLRPRSIESRAASPSGSAGSRSSTPARSGATSGLGLDPALAADDRGQGARSDRRGACGRRPPAPRARGRASTRGRATRAARGSARRAREPRPRRPARRRGPPRTGSPSGWPALPREVGERSGGVEAAFLDGRQDERLGREGFEIGEGNGLGGRAPRPRRRDGSVRRGPRPRPRASAGRARTRRRPTPCRRPGGAPSPGRGRRKPRARARPRGRRRRRGPRGPTPRAGGGRATPSTVPASQAFVRAPASRATCTAW